MPVPPSRGASNPLGSFGYSLSVNSVLGQGTPEVGMRVSRGILSLTVALAVAPVGIGFAHGRGSLGGGGVTRSAARSRAGAPQNAAKADLQSLPCSLKEAHGDGS